MSRTGIPVEVRRFSRLGRLLLNSGVCTNLLFTNTLHIVQNCFNATFAHGRG